MKAAELGSINAQCALGTYYATGDWSGPRDLAEAAKWYGRAADAGDLDAQYELGFMLLLGEGVAKDLDGAVALLKKAALHGQGDAVRLLVDIYGNGAFGGTISQELASFWRGIGGEQKKCDNQ
jgi:TPR repeat protein